MQLLKSAGRQWDDLCVARSFRSADQRRGFVCPTADQYRILRELVVPGVAELVHRPSFRGLVSWPLELLSTIESRENRAIAAFQVRIRSGAEQLLRHLQGQYVVGNEDGEFARQQLLQVIAQTHERWLFAEDFFRPQVGTTIQAEGGKRIQYGQFVTRYSQELTDFGNCMARCLMVRATSILSVVGSVARKLRRRLVSRRETLREPWNADLRAAEGQLEQLRELLLTSPAARLSEGAIVLLQLFLAFAEPPPRFDWLPVPNSDLLFSRSILRMAFEHPKGFETYDAITLATQTVTNYYDRLPSQLSEEEEAIASRALVIDLGANEVYWQCQRIPFNVRRHFTLWNSLLALARAGARGSVDVFDLFDDELTSRSALSTRIGRLKKLLPKELAACIVTAEREKYRLDLAPEKILFLPHRTAATD